MIRRRLSTWGFWMVLAYFILALYVVIPGGLLDSHRNDKRQIMANTNLARENKLRAERACLRTNLIVSEVARIANDPTFIERINAINDRYPGITPCFLKP